MEYHLTDNWLIVTYTFVGWMLIVGAIAGKHDKNTRIMAVQEATTLTAVENGGDKQWVDEGVEISRELESRLKSSFPLGWFECVHTTLSFPKKQ